MSSKETIPVNLEIETTHKIGKDKIEELAAESIENLKSFGERVIKRMSSEVYKLAELTLGLTLGVSAETGLWVFKIKGEGKASITMKFTPK
ncbi:MAG: hypothetical protein ACFFAO_02850 [Candidatus Hermodarchaeota archaeon]